METLIFKNNKVKIKFEDDVDAYFYALKDREEINGAIKVIITDISKENSNHICTYYKTWNAKEKLNTLTYSKFIKSFLEDLNFRNDLYYNGIPWNDTIKFSDSNGVNSKCAATIERLNKSKKLQFKDFASLKSYGFDKFSKMKYTNLVEIISSESLRLIENAFQEEELITKALKWTARGLKPELSIRKIKTDLEITKNSKQR